MRTSNGRPFRMDGAAYWKVRAPIFSLFGNTFNRRVSADDRSDRFGTAITIFDERYDGSPDSRTLYVSVATLTLILHLIGSQCSFWRVAEILVRPVYIYIYIYIYTYI